MLNEKEDHFLFTVNCYNKSGLRKSSGRARRFVSLYILLPLLIVLYGMIIFNFRYKNNNVFEIAEVFESMSTFAQLLTRKVLILVHGELFEEIIRDRTNFWKYDLYGKAAGEEFRRKMYLSVSLIKNLWFGSIFSLAFHFCTPFFVEGAVLPDSCWIPGDSQFVIVTLYSLEMFFYVEVIFLLGVFDAFFLCMCTELNIQFSLLNETIRINNVKLDGSIDNEELFMNKLKECSRYHNFLLVVHNKLNKIFSEYFVCQYLINVGGVCIQFFIINNESSNTTQILRSIVYIVIATFLGALIFVPSSAVEREADKLGREIYSINWQNTSNLNIRKFITFWLMKAQKPIYMTGAGLIYVNRNILIQIPRTAFTIATLLSKVN